ncbi:hypothetical protein Save01_01912 [Streptomyces avermitilis]|uniref:Uncharacterized protein n=1 Tax=Streptomyces avermitilis TaxID=33903 RepID=A0A4D4MBN8_STRAX|nr:hypothetical protein SAVMC3_09690 [Streptomyces avermitilis]GDY69293.1 hypothetical protein SAV14893_086860 [Streptomyces avermitilis]GDY79546.1 hypothetical protein SAV31267_090310 [Streptomyces avermitilis]GDY88217.1 hypothetical protein SAVCW2_74160 [Streptomyces avermitilis]
MVRAGLPLERPTRPGTELADEVLDSLDALLRSVTGPRPDPPGAAPPETVRHARTPAQVLTHSRT